MEETKEEVIYLLSMVKKKSNSTAWNSSTGYNFPLQSGFEEKVTQGEGIVGGVNKNAIATSSIDKLLT